MATVYGQAVWQDVSKALPSRREVDITLDASCHYLSYFHGSTALGGLCVLIVEVLKSHSHTPHSVGLLWTSDRSDAGTFTWQHTTYTGGTLQMYVLFSLTM